MFAVGLYLWLSGDAYAKYKADLREATRVEIIRTYYMPEYAELRQSLIEKYHFTEDEVMPKIKVGNAEISIISPPRNMEEMRKSLEKDKSWRMWQ